jgi:hypothetical protein
MATGWIKEDGSWLTCGHAEHDELVESLGLKVGDVEKRWVRVSRNGVYCMGDITQPQASALLADGALDPFQLRHVYIAGGGWNETE